MHEAKSFRVFRWVVLVVLGAFTVVPLYVMVTSSLKPLGTCRATSTGCRRT